MSQCGRCSGTGEVKQFYLDGTHGMFRCIVCLGLGSYETNPKYERPPMDYHLAVMHSNLKIEDAIALLPEGEPT